jgi:hypothetical protein
MRPLKIAKTETEIKCDHYIQRIDKRMGIAHTVPCDRKVIATAKHKSGVTGKFVVNNVCRMHLNSIKAYEKRLQKRIDYDIQLKITML